MKPQTHHFSASQLASSITEFESLYLRPHFSEASEAIVEKELKKFKKASYRRRVSILGKIIEGLLK